MYFEKIITVKHICFLIRSIIIDEIVFRSHSTHARAWGVAINNNNARGEDLRSFAVSPTRACPFLIAQYIQINFSRLLEQELGRGFP